MLQSLCFPAGLHPKCSPPSRDSSRTPIAAAGTAVRNKNESADKSSRDRPQRQKRTSGQSQWSTIAPYAIPPGLLIMWLWPFGFTYLECRYSGKFGLTGKLYYVILLPMGLAASGFLFGVLRSYARYRGKQLGGMLVFGGPIVAFAMVVIGRSFSLQTSLPFRSPFTSIGEAGPQEIVLRNSGRVVMDLGGDRRSEPIGENGQAFFPAIPHCVRRRGARMRVFGLFVGRMFILGWSPPPFRAGQFQSGKLLSAVRVSTWRLRERAAAFPASSRIAMEIL